MHWASSRSCVSARVQWLATVRASAASRAIRASDLVGAPSIRFSRRHSRSCAALPLSLFPNSLDSTRSSGFGLLTALVLLIRHSRRGVSASASPEQRPDPERRAHRIAIAVRPGRSGSKPPRRKGLQVTVTLRSVPVATSRRRQARGDAARIVATQRVPLVATESTSRRAPLGGFRVAR